jgi:Tfp pilus assembly protein PilF
MAELAARIDARMASLSDLGDDSDDDDDDRPSPDKTPLPPIPTPTASPSTKRRASTPSPDSEVELSDLEDLIEADGPPLSSIRPPTQPRPVGAKPPAFPRAVTARPPPPMPTVRIPPVRQVTVNIPPLVPPAHTGATSPSPLPAPLPTRPPSSPSLPEVSARTRTPSAPPPLPTRAPEPELPAPVAPIAVASEPGIPLDHDDIQIEGAAESLRPSDDDGVAPGSVTPNVVVDGPLEHKLETPTALERAIADNLGDAALDRRAAALDKQLAGATDKRAIAALAYELGELYERRLADEARAVKAYGRALAADPSHRSNLWAIRRVFYGRALWPNLMKLIDAEIRFARNDHERADLFVEKGRILGDKLGQPVEARAAFLEAQRLSAGHHGALLELERIGERDKDHALLATTWRALADASSSIHRKTIYLIDLARLTADQGDHPGALEILARAAETGADPDRVNAERIRVAEAADDSGALLAALDERASLILHQLGIDVPADPAHDPPQTERAAALRSSLVAVRRRQAQVARASNAATSAWDYLQNALALSPSEPVVLADLIDLAEELGRYDDLAELVEAWQSVEGDAGRGLMLSLRRADALLRGGQRDNARALLGALEAAHRGFVALVSLRERDALAEKDIAGLAAAYLAAADAARLGTSLGPGIAGAPDPDAAAALYVMASELLVRPDATPDGPNLDAARAALSQANECVPDYPPAIEARIDVAEARGEIAEAAALLAELVERSDPARQRDALERLSRLYRARGDLEGALDADRRLLALGGADPRLPWRIEGTLAQLGRDEDRAAHLEALAQNELDTTRKGGALLASARLFERLGQIERAIELYRGALEVDPDDTFARASLIDLLRAAEQWSELVAARQTEAAQLADGTAARRALREAAWITEVRLAKPADAAKAWRAMLDRAPDDPVALEGLARTLERAGDAAGTLDAIGQIAEAATPAHAAETALAFARALDDAGRGDEAVEAYRKVMSLDGDGTLEAQVAALSLIDLAVARGDTGLRIEATTALAGWSRDPSLRAALTEDIGWLSALVLEDYDRAASAFEGALAAEPARRGALLGAALIAARRGDTPALATAYGGLAGVTQMTEAASALYLRAAALAAASGRTDEATARIASARAIAADDVGAMVVAAESWQGPPQTDDRATVIDALLARAELLAIRAELADDPKARGSWELDRAEVLEQAGRLREAGTVVAGVLRGDPEDIRGLETLRRLARRGNDRATLARASLALARRLGDGEAKMALLREAAAIFDPPERQKTGATDSHPTIDGRDVRAAIPVYRRILAEDIGASEFPRFCELLRQHSDVAGLVATLTDRLAWIDGGNADERGAIAILLERATVHFGLGDRAAAIGDLDDLLNRDPAHAEALRFRGDLALADGDAAGAVDLWRRYLQFERRPERKGEVELLLARVLAEDINDLAGAIEQLSRVLDQQPDDPAHHERMVNLATRAGDWARVATSLRELGRMRTQPPDRARDELRLATVLRDRLNDRAAARLAHDRARSVDPLNLDVVRELSELLEPPARAQVLAGAASDLRLGIAKNPSKVGLYDRLSMVAAWQSDVDARWLALLGVEAMGTPSGDQRQVLARGRAMLPVPSRVKLAPEHRMHLAGVRDPKLLAALASIDELWRAMAPAVAAAIGVDATKLGFARGDKIAFKKLGERFDATAAVLASAGVTDVEIYISEARGGMARVVSAETPVVCLGADVAGGKSGPALFQLGRVAQYAHAATGVLAELRDAELVWYWAAALRAADVALPPGIAEAIAGDEAAVADRTKLIAKHLGRRRKIIATSERAKTIDATELHGWRRHQTNIANRAGLLQCGDLAVALAMLDAGRGGRSLVDSAPALDLVAWSVGDGHLQLRSELGYALGAEVRR